MASFKFFSIVCMVFLIANVQAKPQERKTAIDVLGIIKKLVKDVEKLLDTVLTDIKALVDDVTDDTWGNIMKKVDDLVNKDLGVVLDKILKDVNRMADANGSPASKKLAGCISNVRDDILAVPIGFMDDITKCVTTDLLALVKTLAPLLKDLDGVQAQAKQIADKVDDCQGNDLSGLLCVAQVAGDLLELVSQIPAKIQTDITPIKDAAKAFVQTTVTCVKNEVPTYFTSAGKVLDKVAVCAAA